MNEDEDDFDDDDEEDEYLFGDDEEEEDLVASYEEEYDDLEDDEEDYDEEDYDEDNPWNAVELGLSPGPRLIPSDHPVRGAYDFDEEDERAEEEDRDRCMMCGLSGIKTHDRWNFRTKDDTGAEEPAWICRQCHGQFESIDQFNKFASNIQFRRLYMKASLILRMIVMDAPVELISKSVTSLASVLFWTDEHGGSEKVRKLASEHLRDTAEKYLGDRND